MCSISTCRALAALLVLGCGFVACELAQYLRRIGARVIVLQRSRHILSGHSAEASAVVERAFRDEGIELFTGVKISRRSAGPPKAPCPSHSGTAEGSAGSARSTV